jgi:thiamine biosynthesis lipoprotein
MNPYLLLVTILLSTHLNPVLQAAWVHDEQSIMGTTVRAEVWSADDAAAATAVTAVMEEMRRIDRLMSPYKPNSELSRVNTNAAQHPIRVGKELRDLVRRSLEISELTNGAFDITFASVGRHYDYRKRIRPADGMLAGLLPVVGFRHVLIDENAGTVAFTLPGVRIDLGGIAKGHAVDKALAILRQHDIEHALISAGGDTGILGNRIDRPWVVAIRDPRDRDAVVAMLPLQDEALSTSGDYERYFEQDGVRYHHILNPSTGRSAGEVRSVSILGPNATTTDALSTSVFVLGVEEGMALVESLPGIEAVIIDHQAVLHYSEGLVRR